MTFAIFTDSTADLSNSWVKENDVTVLGLTIQLDGVTYETVGDQALTSVALLEKMAAGSQPTTSQVNAGQFEEAFRAAVSAGKDVLYLGLASVLSGTYQSAVIARDLVLEDFPEAQIELIDTKAATIGEGYLVMQAAQARAAGKSLAETVALVEELIPRLRTYVMVDDLQHLVRGGRLSKAAGLIGGLVNIKPLLTLDAQGKLVPFAKLRGKKKAVREMVRLLADEGQGDLAMLAFTGEESVTEDLKAAILAETSVTEFIYAPLGPVIATHTGMGTLAVLFVGKTNR